MLILIRLGCGQFVKHDARRCVLLQMRSTCYRKTPMSSLVIVRPSITHGFAKMLQKSLLKLSNSLNQGSGNQWAGCGLKPISICQLVRVCCAKWFTVSDLLNRGLGSVVTGRFFPTTSVIPELFRRLCNTAEDVGSLRKNSVGTKPTNFRITPSGGKVSTARECLPISVRLIRTTRY